MFNSGTYDGFQNTKMLAWKEEGRVASPLQSAFIK